MTRVLVNAGLVIEDRGVVGLTVFALILEIAIWGRGEVDLVSETAVKT